MILYRLTEVNIAYFDRCYAFSCSANSLEFYKTGSVSVAISIKLDRNRADDSSK
jgi:hypothetical protein